MGVFSLLGYASVQQQLEDTAYDESNNKNPNLLRVSGLLYLLQDLEKKVSFKFANVASNPFQVAPKASDTDRAQFACLARRPAREVAKQVEMLLPTLCKHLETIYGRLQTLVGLPFFLFFSFLFFFLPETTQAQRSPFSLSFLFILAWQAQSQSSVADFMNVNEKELAECLRLIFSIIDKYLRWIELPEDRLLV